MDAFMRESDAFAWYMERDPILRSTVVAVAWLDRCPDWDVLRAKLDRATRLVPLFRKRIVELPQWLATPRWSVDDAFDLSWHLRRIELPAPRTPAAVVEFARRQAMTGFDHARPLWEFTLIDHLDGDQAALVMKVHHSLTDGLGGMELALLLFDTEPDAAPSTDLPEGPARERLDPAAIVGESLARVGGRLAGFVRKQARAAVPSVLHTTIHPLTSLEDALETGRSIYRAMAPARETLSPIMKRRGLGRELDVVEVGVEDLRRAASTVGGTLNDGFMAAVTGGLRRYHERHGAAVEALRVMLPISIRTNDDPIGGNRITLMRFAASVSDPRPERRVADLHRQCLQARRERSIAFTNGIAGTLNLLPARAVRDILKHVDFLASDVPGFSFPVYLAGARLERYVAFGPTIGSSVNLTLLSYNGTCHIGVNLDSAAIPDHGVFVDCMRQGFDEVLALGGEHEPARLPLHHAATLAG
jgi:diacylglycerol O-acyltransferase / wax synthase